MGYIQSNNPINNINFGTIGAKKPTDVSGNSIYGNTTFPQSNNSVNDNKQLYAKLKNRITYNTTGFNREERNIGKTNSERW